MKKIKEFLELMPHLMPPIPTTKPKSLDMDFDMGRKSNLDFKITDELLKNSFIAAYNNSQKLEKGNTDKKFPYNPKRFPKKAIRIVVDLSCGKLEIYLNTFEKCWLSKLIIPDDGIYQLSDEQYAQFFKTIFYKKLINFIKHKWPISKDKFHKELFEAILNTKYRLAINKKNLKEDISNKETGSDANDKENQKTHSPSGRKYVHFSDLGISTKDSKFYCWPPIGKEWKWSTWKNWRYQRPFAKMTFKHNGINYGVTIPLYDDNYKYRGFRAYDNDWEPPLAWLSKKEFIRIPKLSIFQKFIKQCTKRIQKYISYKADEILEKIDKPENITKEEILKTKSIIQKVLDSAIKPGKFDEYKWRK